MLNNVKLVVCDVDGTLLPAGETEISRKVFEAIDLLKKKGIVFALASGRSYPELLTLFNNDSEIIYICADGSLTVSAGVTVYSKPIADGVLNSALCRLKNSDFFLYGKDCVYASSALAADKAEIYEKFPILPISSLKEGGLIYKLAVFGNSENSAYAEHYVTVNRLLRKCYKKGLWTEYVTPDADKGGAVSYLQNLYNIKYEETAVFGDGENDISMLKKACFSYAAGNAQGCVKALARYCAYSCADEIINNFLK